MIKCKKCDTDKPEDQMKMRAGAPSKVCLECDAKAKAERDRMRKVVEDAKAEQRSARGKRKKRKAAPAKRAKEVTEALEIELPAGGFGFRAFLTTDGHVQITQKNDGAPDDNICLVRHEVRQFIEKFASYAGLEVASN